METSKKKNVDDSETLLSRARSYDGWAQAGNSLTKYDRALEGVYPTYARCASGGYLWDIDGNKYIDYMLGYGTVILGHADMRVNDAVIRELRTGTCLSPLWRATQAELAECLTSIVPGAEMAYLMRTGSDTTSGAVRLARIYTGRSKIVRWGYNGWHDWCSVRPDGVPESVRDETLTFEFNDISTLRAVFATYPDEIACVLMMPFELERPSPGFLQNVQSLAHQNGALFILDEMRSGFRMALGGAQQYFGLKADLSTFGKAMSNGYTISAIVGRKVVLEGLRETRMTSTFYGNSAEMAAALATIQVLQSSETIEQIWSLGESLQAGLRNLISMYNVQADVPGYPPFPYIEFTEPDKRKRDVIKHTFYTEAVREGVLLHPSHHWFICGSHTSEDIQYTLAVFENALRRAAQVANA